jgi:hypothetical protein
MRARLGRCAGVPRGPLEHARSGKENESTASRARVLFVVRGECLGRRQSHGRMPFNGLQAQLLARVSAAKKARSSASKAAATCSRGARTARTAASARSAKGAA